jgi:hypothetical protein
VASEEEGHGELEGLDEDETESLKAEDEGSGDQVSPEADDQGEIEGLTIEDTDRVTTEEPDAPDTL